MHRALTRRIAQFIPITSDEIKLLDELCCGAARQYPAKRQIVNEGEPLRGIPYILKGLLCSYKHLEDGRWQILSFSVEGDLCCRGIAPLDEADHSLRTVSEAIILEISFTRFESLVQRSPALATAFSRAAAVDSAITRERLLALGQRSALERCAHLLCELFWRLRHVGRTRDRLMDFSVTQEELGSAIGVSTVHANRMLRDLRTLGLIAQHRNAIEILNLDGLEQLALFSPHYLKLQRETPPLLAPAFLPQLTDHHIHLPQQQRRFGVASA